jgi:hypothetical protein
LSECVHEAVFTQNLLMELTGEIKAATIYKDNLGEIFLVKNQQISTRTKHIDIRHHFMRELQANKYLIVRFKRSEKVIHEKHTKKIRNGTLAF